MRSKRAKERKVKIEEIFEDFKNNGPFAAVSPGKKMSPSFIQENFSFSRSPLGFCQVLGARRCASRVERRHCSMLAVVGEEGGGSRPMFPRGSVGSRRGNAAVSRSSGPLVPRVAGRSTLEHAAMTKLSAEEKDASAFCKRDVGDGIVAVRSAFGARRGVVEVGMHLRLQVLWILAILSRVHHLLIRLVGHHAHACHTLMLCFLLLLVHLLPHLLHVVLHLHLLLLGCACMLMAHSCMMHVPIRGRTRLGRVPRGGGAPKVGFPVWPKICTLSQRWRQV